MPYKRIRSFWPVIWLTVFSLVSVCNISIAQASTMTISGLIEAKLDTGKNFSNKTYADIRQSTVEIGIDSEISEWVSAHALALYAENIGPLKIDEATITFGNKTLSPFSLVIGQHYLPFGFYETNMISDPLTQKIGETADSAVTFAYDDNFNFAIYMFNGDINLNPDQEEKIDKFGFNLGYVFQGDDIILDIGIGYINSIGDSNGLGKIIIEGIAGGVTKFIPGVASHVLIEWGNFIFIADHVFATDDFAAQELQGGLTPAAAKPSALNIEFALNVNDETTLAIGIQQTVDMQTFLPESRGLFTVSRGLSDNTSIAVELGFDRDYGANVAGGSGENASMLTILVASEF